MVHRSFHELDFLVEDVVIAYGLSHLAIVAIDDGSAWCIS
jgi:hypothetical protein